MPVSCTISQGHTPQGSRWRTHGAPKVLSCFLSSRQRGLSDGLVGLSGNLRHDRIGYTIYRRSWCKPESAERSQSHVGKARSSSVVVCDASPILGVLAVHCRMICSATVETLRRSRFLAQLPVQVHTDWQSLQVDRATIWMHTQSTRHALLGTFDHTLHLTTVRLSGKLRSCRKQM